MLSPEVHKHKDQTFLEVGSLQVNGSVRDLVMDPKEYVGIDMLPGPGVDVVTKAEDYNPGKQFDWVLSTSTLEHCEDWRAVVNKIKEFCKPEGRILVTTHSRGMFRHNYPNDYWRWSIKQADDMFRDFHIEQLVDDSFHPGWLLVAQKPKDWTPIDLSGIEPEAVP